MSYRMYRVANVVREVVSDAMANRLSDPRISRFTSVTRVEMSRDLQIADVYVSVMGSEADGNTTMKGLQSACGLVQSLLARRLNMRHCPELRFHLDLGLKIAQQVIRELDEVLGDSPPGGLEPPDDLEYPGEADGGAEINSSTSGVEP